MTDNNDQVFVCFDGPPGPECGRFVEVETADGKSVRAGEWEQEGDYWYLGPFYREPPDIYATRAQLADTRARLAGAYAALMAARDFVESDKFWLINSGCPHDEGGKPILEELDEIHAQVIAEEHDPLLFQIDTVITNPDAGAMRMLAGIRDAEIRLRGAGMLGGEDDPVRIALHSTGTEDGA